MIIKEDDYIEHFGKKGMKWGVRSQRTLETHARVAAGKGSRMDKVRVASTVSRGDLYINGFSLQRISAKKHKSMTRRKAKMIRGKASTLDMIAHSGNFFWMDIRKPRT